MNWDWDKLQERKERQGKPQAPQGDKPESPFGDFQLGKYLSRFTGNGVPIVPIVALVLLIWLASGIFIVNPGEVGVVTRFGSYDRQEEPGPHYRLPFPIESSIIVNVKLLRTVEIGLSADSAKASSQVKAEESSMFTGDENIVHMQFNVQYDISDARKFLFHVKEPTALITSAAEAAMREVVGRSNIDAILTSGRAEVQVAALAVLESILNTYDLGVRIHTVQLLDVQPPAEVEFDFKDVATAREDKERFRNQAEAYYNKIVPLANGTALGMVNAANAYKQEVLQAAEGEAHRFLAMVAEFNKAQDITRKRIYLETMNEIFSSNGLEKVIISKGVSGGILPLLNLDTPKPPAAARPEGSATPGSGPKPESRSEKIINKGQAR